MFSATLGIAKRRVTGGRVLHTHPTAHRFPATPQIWSRYLNLRYLRRPTVAAPTGADIQGVMTSLMADVRGMSRRTSPDTDTVARPNTCITAAIRKCLDAR